MNKAAIMSMCLGLFFHKEHQTNERIIGDYVMDGRNKLIEASKKIATAFSDDACYQCGACCKEMPCQYGDWDEAAHQCRCLVLDRNNTSYATYKCGKYREIIEAEQGKKYPMFGGGCFRPLFNSDRQRIVDFKRGRR